jgi:diguanylate cyclase (GGDEF)-like protein
MGMLLASGEGRSPAVTSRAGCTGKTKPLMALPVVPLIRWCRLPALAAGARRLAAGCRMWLGCGRALGALALLAAAALPCAAVTNADIRARAEQLEVDLPGFPKRMVAELEALAPQARGADAGTRRLVAALHGQALAAVGRNDEAGQLAERLEREGRAERDDALVAIALLLRSAIESRTGDESRANALASESRNLVAATGDDYVRFWAALAAGVSARMLGRSGEASTHLQEAYALADAAKNPYRRANALYWLSVLHRYLNQPEKALAESRAAFDQARQASSVYGMVKGKAAESAALEVLDRPVEELAAMHEALAIARKANSEVMEAFALINLADIHLRRGDFKAAYDISAQSLEIVRQLGDKRSVAVNKANMGFALYGLGRIDSGKRLAEEALAEYERAGANAETADLLGDFGQYLADAGDYKAALALREQQQRVLDKIALAIREHAVLEMQKNFAAERRIRDIELQHRQSQERIWWLLVAVFALAFAIVAVAYRTVRRTNRLLAQKNAELGLQSIHDPLTALYNRRHFQNFIKAMPKAVERRRGAGADPTPAILLIDLDHFKLINDRFGHAGGDAALISVARRLRDAVRETDMIVRWGGEEFLVFLPVAPAGQLDEVVPRLMHAVSAAPISILGQDVHLTVSIGYSPLRLQPDNVALGWERALGLADKALYMAKRHGRNRAYGVLGIRRAGADALAAVEADLERAWQDGAVDLRGFAGAGEPGGGDEDAGTRSAAPKAERGVDGAAAPAAGKPRPAATRSSAARIEGDALTLRRAN